MSKFKCGDKVRLKADANFWGENHLELKKRVLTVSKQLLDGDSTVTILECVEAYPNDFELVEPAPEKHIHYDMIVEWAANPSRVVEINCFVGGWEVEPNPTWREDEEYRFKPEEPERVFPTTSLTDEELISRYNSGVYCSRERALRDVVDTAIKQYILEQEASK